MGTPGRPCFIKVQFSSSCSDACKKYLPSVNKAASWFETTAKPAEPLKPEIHWRLWSHSAPYSLYLTCQSACRMCVCVCVYASDLLYLMSVFGRDQTRFYNELGSSLLFPGLRVIVTRHRRVAFQIGIKLSRLSVYHLYE